MFRWVVLGLVITTSAAIAEENSLKRFEFQEIRMGVPFRIIMYVEGREVANSASKEVFARIRELDLTCSDYDPDSELNQLKKSPVGHSTPISDDLGRVLNRGLCLAEKTGGTFDPTIGPLTRLWRRARRAKQLPDKGTLQASRNAVGHHHLQIDHHNSRYTATLKQTEMAFDLGGIAKGFAADEGLVTLKKHGITRALIDASGDLAIGEAPPDKAGWTIGIAALKSPDAEPVEAIVVEHCGVATSGDAYQYIEIDGTRYSHIVDPHTGYGLTNRCSVTVIAKDGTAADAYASALSVMGPKAGIEFAYRTKDLDAYFVELSNGEPERATSKNFPSTVSVE
ncbi:FAD:protein FMN transferase [Calycomorphotria hydatis]|uniref:FAD:protein FMN transferase n=1 Tax=Calycomorphotria hydatis TaxID=2528027 RepID=A0A517T9I6_9PLAN|nr:FAD:protein FMN transferase [Calycomorphotria hydatis]QDT65037.1 Thiamine biosynthesis lipoprotein ApbE precursor [Calycomorphotria hydatis]